jgi:general secretion pathway protein G
MKKSGFTMIELIFVIVILGILAAVAIPKLAATRDDAKIAKSLTEISTAVQDLGAYYTAQGSFGTMSEMTNVKFTNADSNLTVGPNYQMNGTDCIDFNTTSQALADGNVSVSMSSTQDALCTKIQTVVAAQDLNRTHSFGGQKVVW